jgi:UDP-N-acetylglucosamine 2-epimerase
LYRLPALKLLVYQVVVSGIVVFYGVHEEKPLVFLKRRAAALISNSGPIIRQAKVLNVLLVSTMPDATKQPSGMGKIAAQQVNPTPTCQSFSG